MLGLADMNIFVVFILCFISTGFCVIYGVVNWNKGGEDRNISVENTYAHEESEDHINQQQDQCKSIPGFIN